MENLSLQDRVALTHVVMHLLDEWGVPPEGQIAVLGLPAGTKPRALRRYREETPLPDDAAVNERIEHLLGIADALRTTFPRNGHMGPRWMNRPHRRFQQRSPVAILVEDGLQGLIAVRSDLDCAYAWSQSS
jgi:uncharacterized protein (DUF2384 family)